MWMVLLSMLLKKMEEVIHKMKNGIDAINMSTRMDVVLTVEAGSKKMMRMDIRLIMSVVDKLINDDGQQVDKDGRQVDKDGQQVDKDGRQVNNDDGRQVDKGGRPALTVVLLASLQHRARPRLLIPVLQT